MPDIDTIPRRVRRSKHAKSRQSIPEEATSPVVPRASEGGKESSSPRRYVAHIGREFERPVKPDISPKDMARMWEEREAAKSLEPLYVPETHYVPPERTGPNFPFDDDASDITDNEDEEEQRVAMLSARFLASAAKFDRAKVFHVNMTDEVAHAQIPDDETDDHVGGDDENGLRTKGNASRAIRNRVKGLEVDKTPQKTEINILDPNDKDSPVSVFKGVHMFRAEDSAVKKVAGHFDETDWDKHHEYRRIMGDFDKEVCPEAPIWPPRKCDL
eukprot:CAMPEP_0198334034 /NCGR_PEP_ID=MMETSP1450-20131203/19354_1 /TAXON_ID=753684 ORGANISM="Madagascaria erythrocladiodes, Strain CCMP3234" /NCGR_SAMPLE_ID=MMETSP1450 /ASSEMBLY_ACC=CAM_ASM_001115 /LENGTH=271 /DNA_ID=CAMNT_0044038597 /DNA_START=217 /DNA_END=1032 /DNA_ORIENTATION=-